MVTQVSLILASKSPYRRQLLERLQLPFQCIAANIDEAARRGELPRDYVCRLAKQKAMKVAQEHTNKIVIGSDQCAVVNGKIVGKPLNRDNAVKQLLEASDNTLDFLTAVYIAHQQTGRTEQHLSTFQVAFRPLSREEIERYVDQEQPYDCAGSFKSEGLGITLCHSMQGDDPTALIGLPLIQTCRILRQFGIQLP